MLASCFVLPQTVSAQSAFDRQNEAFAGQQGAQIKTTTDARIVVVNILKVAFGFIGILFTVYTIYAGYLIMFSAGDQERVNKGKDTLRTAVIGVVVAFSATGIMVFVADAINESMSIRDISGGQDAFFESGASTRPYDFCSRGEGDAISCPDNY